jgi:hypothetical protein
MYKQNKILDVIKCNDVLDGKLGKVPLYIKTHLSEFRPGNWDDDTISVDPLDKQLELWRSEAYFLPIEQWVNIFPEKQIKAFLKASGL